MLHGAPIFGPGSPPPQFHYLVCMCWSLLCPTSQASWVQPALLAGLWSTCIASWYIQNHPDRRLQSAWGKPLSKMGSFSSAFSLLNSVLVLESHLPVGQTHSHLRCGRVETLLFILELWSPPHPTPTPRCCRLRAEGSIPQDWVWLSISAYSYTSTATIPTHPHTYPVLTWANGNRQIMSTAKSLRCHILIERIQEPEGREQYPLLFIDRPTSFLVAR